MEFLETTEGIVILSIIVLCVFYWIFYEIIKSATKGQYNLLRTIMRFKAIELKKKGYSVEQIKDMYDKTDEEFWKLLSEI